MPLLIESVIRRQTTVEATHDVVLSLAKSKAHQDEGAQRTTYLPIRFFGLAYCKF